MTGAMMKPSAVQMIAGELKVYSDILSLLAADLKPARVISRSEITRRTRMLKLAGEVVELVGEVVSP